jgi:hypothetical protein
MRNGPIHRSVARREFFRHGLASLVGLSASGWLPFLARELQAEGTAKRRCVILWMSGGPSQMDTFDMKPGHANGGEFREIATAVPGMRFSEHLPELAKWADQLAIVRGVSTREGDHERGMYLMRTGQRPGTPIAFPCIGSALSERLSVPDATLPDYFSINPLRQISPQSFSPGFLGPRHAPATVGESRLQEPEEPAEGEFAELRVDNLRLADHVDAGQAERRRQLWQHLQHGFLQSRSESAAAAQDTVYRRAWELMHSRDAEAFDLTQEPVAVREAYGRGKFGQGCLLARRLLERNVPVVEVSLGDGLGWDTHQDNFNGVRNLSAQLDRGWSTLMAELRERGMLESTTILWMGEFGRTPQINAQGGRDHFPAAWTCVFGGGGIRGGQHHGATSADGMEVVDGKVDHADILATLCQALGVDPHHENLSPDGRPHRIVDGISIHSILA